MESGHDHLAGLRAPGEIPRRSLRENLRHSFFIGIWYIPVVIEEVAVLKVFLSILGPAGPFMFIAGVIHDEIQAHTDALSVAGI